VRLQNETFPSSGNDSVARICCLKQQVLTLKENIKVAQSLLNRCPTCLSNFIKNYCITTCDPSQSLFMDGTVLSYEGFEYVEQAKVYLTEKFAGDLYNSCANVQNAGGGSKVMNIMCGTSNCNPLKWLSFMGDPNLNGCESPFLIAYNLSQNSTPFPNGITPLDDTGIHQFYGCNQSVGAGGPCSCSDCPSTCPPPPHFSVNHLPFMVIALSVGSAGFIISTIIFIILYCTSQDRIASFESGTPFCNIIGMLIQLLTHSSHCE